ncbi:DNA kinase/phosphatase Pnk1 [Rhodotorula kratochvilovae]
MSSSTGKRAASPPSSSTAPAAKAPRVEDSPTLHRSDRQVQWHAHAGVLKSLMHATYGQPRASSKIAAFALDHTLVRPKELANYFKTPTDWKWWGGDDLVKDKLRALHNEGFAIVLFASLTSPSKEWLDEFKLRVHYILRDLDLPVRIFTSLAYDPYRKPAPAAWFEFEQNWNGGREIDMKQSFFVGGAAGMSGSLWDFDRKFASNLDLAFHTPAEYFDGKPVSKDWKWSGWLARKYDHNVPLFSPTSNALVPKPLTEWGDPIYEVILFVGPPGCGKTHLWKSRFEHNTRGMKYTSPEPSFELKKLLASQPPVSIVIDALLPTRAMRRVLVRHVQSFSHAQHRVRAFVWSASEELAKHNLVYDWLYGAEEEGGGRRRWVSEEEWRRWYGSYEAPDASEDYAEIKTINFKFDQAYWGDEGKARFKHWRTKFLGCYPSNPNKKAWT